MNNFKSLVVTHSIPPREWWNIINGQTVSPIAQPVVCMITSALQTTNFKMLHTWIKTTLYKNNPYPSMYHKKICYSVSALCLCLSVQIHTIKLTGALQSLLTWYQRQKTCGARSWTPITKLIASHFTVWHSSNVNSSFVSLDNHSMISQQSNKVGANGNTSDMHSGDTYLTLIVPMWRIGWAHNNARK